MTTSVRTLILRAFDHPSRPSKWWDANDSVTERGNEVAAMRAELAQVRAERDELLAENVRLSAELAAANVQLDELRAENSSLRESADLSARQRNTRMRYFA